MLVLLEESYRYACQNGVHWMGLHGASHYGSENDSDFRGF
jgi:hypothetical protein